jgi:hypothetical protein
VDPPEVGTERNAKDKEGARWTTTRDAFVARILIWECVAQEMILPVDASRGPNIELGQIFLV